MTLKHLFRVAHSALRERFLKGGRSGAWRGLEKRILQAQSSCEVCGATVRLQVHHVKPFHLHPDLEMEPDNLVVLCMGKNECHLQIGHGGAFRYFNPKVREHIASAKSGKELVLIQEEARFARQK